MAVYNRKDSYYKKAKQEGYKSRAAYKLKELNTKYKIIKSGYKVLDCGAAPGGWSQVALEIVGEKGFVVGVDLNMVTGINKKNFVSIAGDFTTDEILNQVLEVCPLYDAVICLGVVFRGETTHAKHISEAVCNSLADLQTNCQIPIVNGVYLFENKEQGDKRCMDPKYNRGVELANTAIEMAALMKKLKMDI